MHLVVTSQPYWTLKELRADNRPAGSVGSFDEFLAARDRGWRACVRVLVPRRQVIRVVGDVLLSRRQKSGRHTVVPLHAAIKFHCRETGYDNLAPIIRQRVGNADYEAGGVGFLGKPYEPPPAWLRSSSLARPTKLDKTKNLHAEVRSEHVGTELTPTRVGIHVSSPRVASQPVACSGSGTIRLSR